MRDYTSLQKHHTPAGVETMVADDDDDDNVQNAYSWQYEIS